MFSAKFRDSCFVREIVGLLVYYGLQPGLNNVESGCYGGHVLWDCGWLELFGYITLAD